MRRRELYASLVNDPATARHRPIAGASRRQITGVEGELMALQRSAGNAAVVELLGRSAATSAAPALQLTPAPSPSAAPGPAPAPSAARQAPGGVVYVSFQHVTAPAVPDRNLPPPKSTDTADRAGLTRVFLRPRMSTAWDTGPIQQGGKVPLFAQSVNVFFRLDPILVFVSSDYPVGSCPYVVTLGHEHGHVAAFLRLFREARRPLVAALNQASIPTSQAPRLVAQSDVQRVRAEVDANLQAIVRVHQAQLREAMKADKDAKDAPAAYAGTHRRCARAEWLGVP